MALAANIGVTDEERSQRVKVFIQPKPDFREKITAEEIISYLQQKVAKYAVSKSVCFIDEMPLTGMQKVNKKYLREME